MTRRNQSMGVPQLLIHILLVLYRLMNLSQSQGALAKPNCQEYCGRVRIPYPFGIGTNCYIDKWFEIDCMPKIINGTSPQHLKPYLKSINLEVDSIVLEENTIQVLIPVNSNNHSSTYSNNSNYGRGSNSSSSWIELGGSPFFFSPTDNVFVGFGCNVFAYLSDHNDNAIAWCYTGVCFSNSGYEDRCGVQIPQNLQTLRPAVIQPVFEIRPAVIQPVFDISHFILNYTSSNSKTNSTGGGNQKEYSSGFSVLVNQRWFGDGTHDWVPYQCAKWISDYDHPYYRPSEEISSMESVLVTLDWELYNATFTSLGVDNVTTSCQINTRVLNNNSFYTNSSLQCSCEYGYSGNPYLPDGCQDYYPTSGTFGFGWLPDEKKKINWEAVISVMKAIIIGVCTKNGAVLLVIGVWWLYKLVKKEINRRIRAKFFKQNGGFLLQQQLSSSDGNVEKTKIFTSYELEKATDKYNANRVLGQGGQGTVYKGMLSDGKVVAVKKSKIDDTIKVEQFINEVVLLSQINHRNIVNLLGCCLETEVPLLVYEFISKGTLFQHIQDPNEEFPLTWEMRLRIAAEIAGALSYLHSAASVPIYHRDIKSTNILVDDKYRARVSDFGLSRSVDVDKTHLTTLVKGTFGYLDPEYFQSSQFTEKSDVYSFGVVLVELLTGKKPIFSNTSLEIKGLATHFIESMEENSFLYMIDPKIMNPEGKIGEIAAVAYLAKTCLDSNGKRRPTMKEVAVQLEGIRMSHGIFRHQEECEDIENNGRDVIEACDNTSSISTSNWHESTTVLSLTDDSLSVE